jgi:mono/diheme cytochrome c family protein
MGRRFWAWVLGGVVLATGAFAETAAVGSKIENLSFKDIRYLPRTLDDLDKPEKAKAVVLAFMTNECPLAQRYLGKLVEMEKTLGPQGVRFVMVNVGPGESIMDVAQHALDYGAHFPAVKDVTGECIKALGITRTPEIVVLDSERTVRYRGRVDDQYRLGGARQEASRDDLRLALEELLAGKDISVATTVAEGCAITPPAKPEPDPAINYAEHIAPIINKHCITCHREDGGAPMRFDAYKRVSGYAEMIAEVVQEKRMPPWYAHHAFGTFENTRGLSPEEIEHVTRWVAAGSPEGDPAKTPATPVFPDAAWSIHPDVVIKASQQFVLPAQGIVDYKYIFLPYTFEQDTWVQGIQIRSENPRVLHHANLFYSPDALEFVRSENFLTGTVPGGSPADLKDGQAFFIPKGAKIGLQIHYVTTGKMEVDRPMVALRFAKEPVKKRLYYKILDDGKFAIPPYAQAHKVSGDAIMETDATITGLFGHLHLRGKSMMFLTHSPEGKTETLLSMPNYSFDWQLAYYCMPDSVKVTKGTKVECITYYDNSPFNAYNPDPSKTVKYGAQTEDEMMQGFMFYTKDNEDMNLAVDPATGWALTEVASSANSTG